MKIERFCFNCGVKPEFLMRCDPVGAQHVKNRISDDYQFYICLQCAERRDHVPYLENKNN